jgi:hypothetical protein
VSPNPHEDTGYGDPSAQDPKPPQLWVHRFPIVSKPCKSCRERIVWTKTPTGGTIALSFKARKPYQEHGRQVGYVMPRHPADCRRAPRRPRK